MKKWSRNFEQCVQCGKKDAPHFGKGLCRRCYMTAYEAKNSEHIKKLQHCWWLRQGGRAFSSVQSNKILFGGMREVILERDGRKCTKCGSTKLLLVHHKDRQGSPVKVKNNDESNLVTLCRKCHINEHRAEVLAARIAKQSKWWSHFHKLMACKICGRSDRKHDSKGECVNCAARRRWIPRTQRKK